MNIIDLSGQWRWETDEEYCGTAQKFYAHELKNTGFKLPGSTCENKIGKRCEYYDEFSKKAVRAPRERYEYVGALWLSREIDVPKEAEGKSVKLFLERVNIASDLWLDGKKIGRQIIELSAPHIYDLTGRLTPGKHTITLRCDNRNLLNFGDMASGYSIDTQGYWNGIVGRLELIIEDDPHAENIQVYPNECGIKVKLTLAGRRGRVVQGHLSATAPDGREVKELSFERRLFNSRQVEYFDFEFEDILLWNEFTPNLYTLIVNTGSDEKKVRFGMRTIKTEGKKILLNGEHISLRGTIDCAQYPITGYPPFDIDLWRKNFKTIKSFGLNHVRFHAWCPPECAFDAADELGLYISVEMPLWINDDVTPLEYGDDPIHDMYYPNEARVISKTYGNHPSFIMFSNGNETMGNLELLSDITIMMRAYDPRRLYTLTSNFDHPVMPCEDYICAQDVGGYLVRIQNLHDAVSQNTFLDYSEAVEKSPVPIISFEVGQYCSYPNVDICEKYTGNMLPVNFDAIRKHMIKKGVYPRLKEYVAASGALAAKLYKEDIEAALRTKNFGGFELLSLSDYTGQSTATVGMLDVFFENKGFTTPEKFREFAGCVVPLLKAERIYKNTDTVEAELDLYDFGERKIENPNFKLTIYVKDKIFFEMVTDEKFLSVPLDKITQAAMLDVTLSVGEYKNSYKIFVYPENAPCPVVKIISSEEELKEIINSGGSAIVTANAAKETTDGSFIPVFWSPVHFPTNRPSGEIIDEKHPVFDDFPTEKCPDYQWKTLLDSSKNVDISRFDGLKPIVEIVPNFVYSTPTSPLFELRVGKAKLLFCGFDLTRDDLPTRHLKSSIFKYVSSEKFDPTYMI